MKMVQRILLLGCFALLLAACNRKEKEQENLPENAVNPEAVKNPVTASGQSEAESLLPVISFAVESYDFGSIKQGESVTYAFRFKNTGKSDLLISSADAACGCTVADYPKSAIRPGEGGEVKVTFDSKGKEGMQHKVVSITANTIPNTKVLSMTGEVIKP